MDIKDLTREMNRFVADQGWYRSSSPRPQTLKNLACSLAIESGEVVELLQWQDQPADQAALASELADVALYLLQLASVSGIDLEQAVLDTLDVNSRRTWDKE
jgi:NTP pyrophosphatase (non-canonical NTP hydrolase)